VDRQRDQQRLVRDGLEKLQALIGRKIAIQAVVSYHREQYELTVK
jgi:hypothetical protein